MSTFLGVFRYEFRMSIRRWGLLVVFGLGYIVSFIDYLSMDASINMKMMSDTELWQELALSFFRYNLLLPVVGGIAVADRMVRDRKLGMQELLQSTPLRQRTLILGKYFGVLASLLALALGLVLTETALDVVMYQAPLKVLYMSLVVFLAITVPAYAFITAYSLACPLVIPLRVYQVLFTGYWFWGNFLSPKAFPSWSDTILNAAGVYAMAGFFKSGYMSAGELVLYTPTMAALNLLVLAGLTALALFAADRCMAWQVRRD